MKYEILEFDLIRGKKSFVFIEREDGSYESFPVDETNPRYQQFLKETEGAK